MLNNNSQLRRMSINDSGRNSFILETHPSKSEIHGHFWQRLNFVREESLQQTEQYRSKFRVTYNDFQPLNVSSQSKEFPSRPTIPVELIGKSHENHSTNILTNSDLNKSDGLFFLFCQHTHRPSILFRSSYSHWSIWNHALHFSSSEVNHILFIFRTTIEISQETLRSILSDLFQISAWSLRTFVFLVASLRSSSLSRTSSLVHRTNQRFLQKTLPTLSTSYSNVSLPTTRSIDSHCIEMFNPSWNRSRLLADILSRKYSSFNHHFFSPTRLRTFPTTTIRNKQMFDFRSKNLLKLRGKFNIDEEIRQIGY